MIAIDYCHKLGIFTDMQDRQLQIEQFIGSIAPNWQWVTREIDNRLEGLIVSLISTNSEETRGRIKALRDLRDLPTALQQELEAIKADLS